MKAARNVQKFLSRAREGFRGGCAKVAVVGGAAFAPVLAHAQLSTTEVETAINQAKDSGLTVGGVVIAAVAGLVVIGVIITIVKKI